MSHLLPAQIYPLCRTKEFEPILLTDKVMRPSIKQTKSYLLCASCEENLSKSGERATVPLLSRLEGSFILYERLVKQEPIMFNQSLDVYASARNPEINVSKLIHFGIGIFWKASVHAFGSGRAAPRITLGENSEYLRLYLQGQADLPSHIALAISVESGAMRYPAMFDPYPGDNPEFNNFYFYVPGVLMQIYIGDGIRDKYGHLMVNVNPDAPILLVPLARDMRAVARKHAANAYRTEKLQRTTLQIEERGLGIRLGG